MRMSWFAGVFVAIVLHRFCGVGWRGMGPRLRGDDVFNLKKLDTNYATLDPAANPDAHAHWKL
jgi:hypothetical protein